MGKIDRRAIKSEITKRLLFESATQLFREKGFYATTIEDIAAAAGTSVGAFYYHFCCKEDLVYTWADDLDQKYNEYYLTQMQQPMHGNALEIIRGMFYLSLDIYSRWGCEFAAVSYSYMMRVPEVCDRMVNTFRLYYRILTGLVRQGQAEGSLRTDIPVEQMVKDITKAVRGAIIDWCIIGGKEPVIERSYAFIETYLDGLRPQQQTKLKAGVEPEK